MPARSIWLLALLGGLCLRSGAVRARRFWYSALSATGLGDLSRRPRGGPPPVGPLVRSIGLDPNFTVARFRNERRSENPTFLAQRERIYEGLSLAGVPEGQVVVGSGKQ